MKKIRQSEHWLSLVPNDDEEGDTGAEAVDGHNGRGDATSPLPAHCMHHI